MTLRIEPNAEPIPGYTLIERLGRGGFGEVWKAEAPGGLHKAIKFVYGDITDACDSGESERANQELKAMARVKTVRHPYILSLERYDIIDGRLVIVMELADRNVWDRFRECRQEGLPGIPREELLGYMRETAEALDLMNHEYQLQHLDIKPQNLFLVHQHIKVADFGLVKDLEGVRATATGGVTPVYASPETFDEWVSRYCDQYSLAIVFQELLTGQRPFDGTNVRQLIMQHLQAEPDVSPLPVGDRDIIRRGLAKEPNQRFPTCTEMVRLLCASGKDERRDSSPPQPGASSDQPPPTTSVHFLPHQSNHHLPSSTSSATEPTPERDLTKTEPSVPYRRNESDSAPEPRLVRRASQEITGDGVLFPTLFLGLGYTGMEIVQHFRRTIKANEVAATDCPWRFVLLDTDPEIVREATRKDRGLSPNEIVLAPLQRPSYYLRGRTDRPPLEPWLSQQTLFRIPRTLQTGGIRSLGRLAYIENYRTIRRRLCQELDGCLSPEVIAKAQDSSHGLRTNRPRVYIATSLAGGTGSGVFLDLAYTVRQLLREEGFTDPEVIGLFTMPHWESTNNETKTNLHAAPQTQPVQQASLMALSNGCAALRELQYYDSPETTFRANYHKREMPLKDAGSPFSRCILLPSNLAPASQLERPSMLELAGQILFEEVCSPLGKARDIARQSLPRSESSNTCFHAVGAFGLRQPRAALQRKIAQRLSAEVVGRWVLEDDDLQYGRDAKGRKHASPIESKSFQNCLSDSVRSVERITFEELKYQLEESLCKSLRKKPETVLFNITEPLVREYITEGLGDHSRSTTVVERAVIPTEEVTYTLRQIVALLGEPSMEVGSTREIGSMEEQLERAAANVIETCDQELSTLTVAMIERPGSRLCGAERFCKAAIHKLDTILAKLESRSQKLAVQSAELYSRLQVVVGLSSEEDTHQQQETTLVSRMLGKLRGHDSNRVREHLSKNGLPAVEILEWLRTFAQVRYESLLRQHICRVYLTLKGNLVEELREVGSCRLRLRELQARFELTSTEPSPPPQTATTDLLLGLGVNSEEAIERMMDQLPAEYIDDLDESVQLMIHEKFAALVDLCISTENRIHELQHEVIQTVERYLNDRLRWPDVVTLFYNQYPTEAEQLDRLDLYFDKAAPPSVESPHYGTPSPNHNGVCELYAFSVPTTEASEQFANQVRDLLADVAVVQSFSTGDVWLYRERCNIALADLKAFGSFSQEAYDYLCQTEHFTPHSRADVPFGEAEW